MPHILTLPQTLALPHALALPPAFPQALEPWQVALVVLAGVWAGGINVIVGSGTLVTFPVLLAVGLPPLAANVSNNLGLVMAGYTGTWGYRRELAAVRSRLVTLVPASAAGALLGAVLLLWLPGSAFDAAVPVLVAMSIVLVLAGPSVQRMVARRHGDSFVHGRAASVGLVVGVFGGGIYGGYFGAAQGVLLIGLMGVLTLEGMQTLNAMKNALATTANTVAAVVFVVAAHEHLYWGVSALVGVGAAIGGVLGARIGRRIPPPVLRGVVVAVGVLALWLLLTR